MLGPADARVWSRSSRTGSCPVDRMKRRRSAAASVVVASFSSGWQLTFSCASSLVSSTAVTREPVSLTIASGVTLPGATPKTSASSSARAKESLAAPRSLASRLRSTRCSSRQVTSHSRSFLSLRNRFLQCPPSRWRVCSCACSTVNTGGMEDGALLDAQFVQMGQHLLASGQHARGIAASALGRKPRRHGLVTRRCLSAWAPGPILVADRRPRGGPMGPTDAPDPEPGPLRRRRRLGGAERRCRRRAAGCRRWCWSSAGSWAGIA